MINFKVKAGKRIVYIVSVARMKQTEILVEPELALAIKRHALAEGVSMAEFVRRCIRARIEPLSPNAR